MLNQQDRQKITFRGSANPKEISQQCTPATHTEAVHCQRRGSSIPVFDQAPGSTFWGEGRQASRQLSDANQPIADKGSRAFNKLMQKFLYQSL